jgi:hypothetical protein
MDMNTNMNMDMNMKITYSPTHTTIVFPNDHLSLWKIPMGVSELTPSIVGLIVCAAFTGIGFGIVTVMMLKKEE